MAFFRFLYSIGLSDTCTPCEIRQIRTINVLNFGFIVTVAIQLTLLLSWGQMSHSLLAGYLLVMLMVSTIFIFRKNHEVASFISLIAFLSTAGLQAFYFQDLDEANFILLLAPLLSIVLFDSMRLKLGILGLSIVLYFLCNYWCGKPLFSNYLFLIGLIPSFIGMAFFYTKLITLENEKLTFNAMLAEQTERLTDFTNSMSHDLKSSVRTISSFSHLLSEQPGIQIDEKGSKYLNFIVQASNRMSSLIDDLMTFAKADQQNILLAPTSIEAVVVEAKANLLSEIEATSAVIEYEELPILSANKRALIIVFQNLISNAIKYQPKDVVGHYPHIQISAQREEDFVVLSISDNGIGISKEFQENIFIPFKRFHAYDDYEGSGLGLSICQKIIEKHKGKISIKSTGPTGTCFSIHLPVNLKKKEKVMV